MVSIRERAAALNLAEKLCVRPPARGVASKAMQSVSMWTGLIAHLRSSVTVKSRQVHLKSHSDCFLGSEAVDVLAKYITCIKESEGTSVSRDNAVCVCQALLECNVFEAVVTKVFCKDKKQKQDVFQDNKSAFYRFVCVQTPSVDDLERVASANGIHELLCIVPSDRKRQEDQPCLTPSHVQMCIPGTETCVTAGQVNTPGSTDLLVQPAGDSLHLSPSRAQAQSTHSVLPKKLVDEVWQEQTLIRLLKVVELPFLEGVLQGCHTTADPEPEHLPALSDPEPINSSSHLDRQILKAFMDGAGKDEWLSAALDCLDFLPDQPVVELSKGLSQCFSQDLGNYVQKPNGDTSQDGVTFLRCERPQALRADPPCLSESNLVEWKLLLYRTMVIHYSDRDRPPLLPQGIADICTTIAELLVKDKLSTALEALQLCLKLLPPTCRDELRRLLSFMAVAAKPHAIQLDKEVENRVAVKRSFSKAIVHNKSLSKDKEELVVVFMLSNIEVIFKIPGALHKVVSDKLDCFAKGKQPNGNGYTICQQVSSRQTTNQELWALLTSIHLDTKTSAKEKKRLLGQFSQAHPEIFNQYFGDAALSVL